MAWKPGTREGLAVAAAPDGAAAIAPVRVLIVDDSEAVRHGLSLLLGSRPCCEVVAAVDDLDRALAHVRDACPDVVLLDFSMPGADPFALLRGLEGCCPRPAVLMLSALANEGSTRRAIAAGAVGWILKDAEPDLLFEALMRAARPDEHEGDASADAALARGASSAVDGGVTTIQELDADGDGASSSDARTVRALLRALQGNAAGATVEEVAAGAIVSQRVAIRHLRRLAVRPPGFVAMADTASVGSRYVLTPAGERELGRLERHIAGDGPQPAAPAMARRLSA